MYQTSKVYNFQTTPPVLYPANPKCILRKAEVADTYAVVEIVDFADIPIKSSGLVLFRIYGITNPTTTAGNFALINLRLRELQANNELKTIYEEEYNLFLNLKDPDSSLIVTYDTGLHISFPFGTCV